MTTKTVENPDDNYDSALVYLKAFEDNLTHAVETSTITDNMRGSYQKIAQTYALLALVDELKRYNDRH